MSCSNLTNDQKFFFEGNKLRMWGDPNYCLEAYDGLKAGSKIQLYYCKNNDNQNWVAGSNDFKSKYTMAIRAAIGGGIDFVKGGGVPGHSLISMGINDKLVNTLSVWPDKDLNCDNGTDKVDILRVNNICDQDNLNIDNQLDREALKNTYDGKLAIYKGRREDIPKKFSDLIRFSAYARTKGYEYGRANKDYSYNLKSQDYNSLNCAWFSSKLWNDVMFYLNRSNRSVPLTTLPFELYINFKNYEIFKI